MSAALATRGLFGPVGASSPGITTGGHFLAAWTTGAPPPVAVVPRITIAALVGGALSISASATPGAIVAASGGALTTEAPS